MISKAAEQSTAFCDLQTHTVQSALDNVCPTVAISTALPPCGETDRISTPDTTTAPENPLSSTDSDTDGPCGVTTRPVNGEGTLEEISHNASDAVHKSISGYEITTQQDEQFVCTSEMVLNGIEHNFGTWYNPSAKYSFPYRDLLACNGGFELGFERREEIRASTCWSTTTTIDSGDQIALQVVVMKSLDS